MPGSGKSTAGRLAAHELRAPFVDVDEAIQRRTGRSVPQIFAEDGEAAFRALERKEVLRVLAVLPSIVAPGGGWAAQPGNLEEATMRAIAVYLTTDPAVAAERVGREEREEREERQGRQKRQSEKEEAGGRGEAMRPLLGGGDLVARMRELLAQRERYYRLAQAAITTDGKTVEGVAHEIVALARNRAGW